MRVDVVIPLCAGRDVCESRRCLKSDVLSHLCILCTGSAQGTYGTAEKGEQWNEWSNTTSTVNQDEKAYISI